MNKIRKRDGRLDDFNSIKIYEAVLKAASTIEGITDEKKDMIAESVRKRAVHRLNEKYGEEEYPDVEDIQDLVIQLLVNARETKVAEAYIKYRDERTKQRNAKTRLMKSIQEITFSSSKDSNLKRDNGNINGDSPMGMMLQYGSAVAKQFADDYIIRSDIAQHIKEGDIYVHDKDFLPSGTLTCCQIPLDRLFKNGFNTGHGFLREPQSIRSYASLAAIAIQSNQNDQHGGQSIPLFDFYMAPGITKSYIANIKKRLDILLGFLEKRADAEKDVIEPLMKKDKNLFCLKEKNNLKKELIKQFSRVAVFEVLQLSDICEKAVEGAISDTEKDTFQAMEALIHNLNTMHSRAGAQVPFSSINFGMDISEEGRMVSRNLLLAQKAGLGNGETPIFPILIFQVKEGVNYNPGDPNYDLFKLSIQVSAERLFPNFVFVDAPFNLQYYNPEDPETIISTMGCRTRVFGNVNGKDTPVGRGNLSFTTINLPRLGIKHGYLYRIGHNDWDREGFFSELDNWIELCIEQLLERYEIQKHRFVKNFPFLMGQGVWRGSEDLSPNEELGDVIDSGTLSVGFIGLAECLKGLTGKHHGESEEAQKLGLEIIGHMRRRMDEATLKYHLNFSLLATPAEGLSGFFTKIDKEKYGKIEGITDKEYYTNSFHVPVSFSISFYNKIQIEAPYHELTNAGHITYVEVDGDLSKNPDAFEIIIRCMKESGIGYGSVNHPLDRDPVCGYSGVIEGNICPGCGRDISKNIIQKEMLRRL